MALLLLAFRNELLCYVQLYRLKSHLTMDVRCSETSKLNLCANGVYSKVWAHRVDSYERFIFLSKSFSGFEVDLVYDEKRDFLDVGHPPVKSIGLSFETFLRDAAGRNKFFWLDLKNLDSANASAILKLLTRLDNLYSIRGRVIVESANISALARISDAGYFTSFYYDTQSYKDFLSQSPASTADSVFAKIDAVSQDVLAYDTLLQRFPAKPRLTWALSARYYLSDSMFSNLDRDHQLLIYLVNIKSPGYR
ncbi:MAG: hypothetical protein ABI151_10440 [Chitinophagaceae bacterium]